MNEVIDAPEKDLGALPESGPSKIQVFRMTGQWCLAAERLPHFDAFVANSF